MEKYISIVILICLYVHVPTLLSFCCKLFTLTQSNTWAATFDTVVKLSVIYRTPAIRSNCKPVHKYLHIPNICNICHHSLSHSLASSVRLVHGLVSASGHDEFNS